METKNESASPTKTGPVRNEANRTAVVVLSLSIDNNAMHERTSAVEEYTMLKGGQ
jgi:hypothetical protein